MNAFAAYVQEQLRDTGLTKENMRVRMKQLSDNWRQMSDAEKERYRNLAAKKSKSRASGKK
jgi:arsenate reductase-like glutaredoxin family protein